MTVQLLPDDRHDRALVAQVHPPDWVNPEPASRYNLVVIGGGTAGLVAAVGAAGLGARVALVERDLLGGDCLNVGCVPSKALLRAARAAAQVRDAGRFGVRVPDGWSVDFPAVMERLRQLRATLSPNDSAGRLRGLGIDLFLGDAAFTGRETIGVAGKTLRFRRALIATGARPVRPDIPGLAEGGFLTNESVFALTELPRRLAVIGAGPIGCELAQAFARLGSRVSLLGDHPRLLPREDADVVEPVEHAFRRDGVELLLGAEVTRVEMRGSDRVVHLRRGAQPQELAVDALLVGVGRAPNVEGLNLDAAGVRFDARKGVQVDDFLRTTSSRIYAAGDVCSAYKFTHAADALARIVVQNALILNSARVSALTIPWCTYTDPEIAHVGLSETEAKARGIRYRLFTQSLGGVDRAVLDGEEDGLVKVLVHPRKDTILGASIVAAHAGEMISEVTLAMVGQLGLKTIARTIHPYPTQAEGLRKVGDAYNRTRLTPTIRWLLGRWLAWGR
jgi:pyruvate/2-oxoglutarate dehydrogenase complex dihydrolipoamide dehydrogenase (E3) component